jgi:hypothetical protein
MRTLKHERIFMRRYLILVLCAIMTVFLFPNGIGGVSTGSLFAQNAEEPLPLDGSSVNEADPSKDDDPAINELDDDIDSESDKIDESELDNIDPWFLDQEPPKKTDK